MLKITFPACAAVDMSQARLKEEGVRAVQGLADVVTRPMGPSLLALVGPWLVALVGACLVALLGGLLGGCPLQPGGHLESPHLLHCLLLHTKVVKEETAPDFLPSCPCYKNPSNLAPPNSLTRQG